MQLRSIAAVVLGILLISVLAEATEFALVGLVNGSLTTDPERYLAIRNLNWFLWLKLGYNFAAGAIGGAVAAHIAGQRPLRHGAVVAGLQTVAFLAALSDAGTRATAPSWAWIGFILATGLGVLAGAYLVGRRLKAPL